MSLLRAIVVDDEPLARRGVRQLLAKEGDIEIVAEARSGEEAIQVLETVSADLLFLDVQMPEVDGLEVLRRLGSRVPGAVIFITAHESYAVRAFEEHALDYLLKPLHSKRFHEAVSRARAAIEAQEAVALSTGLKKLLAERGTPASAATSIQMPRRSLTVTSGRASMLIEPAEIEWIEADNYYSAVYASGRRHLVRTSLSALQKKLDRTSFLRVHRGAVVNLSHVREIRPSSNDGEVIVLRGGSIVPLSRRRRSSFMKALRRFGDRSE